MSSRGGPRKGAGRPPKNKPTTKATIYLEDRELLNSYAQELKMPVNELIHHLLNDEEFKQFIQKIKHNLSKNS